MGEHQGSYFRVVSLEGHGVTAWEHLLNDVVQEEEKNGNTWSYLHQVEGTRVFLLGFYR